MQLYFFSIKDQHDHYISIIMKILQQDNKSQNKMHNLNNYLFLFMISSIVQILFFYVWLNSIICIHERMQNEK
jgi:hypothetical protein